MKKISIKLVSVLSLAAFIPFIAQAQGSSCGKGGLYDILCTIHSLLSAVVPVLVALGVVYFVWGVISYVIADSDEAKTKGRDMMVFGIIGLAVIISVWGLVYILTETFGTEAPGPSNQYLQNLLPGEKQQ